MEQRISDTISLINNFEKYHTDGTFAELSSADNSDLDYDDQNSSEADFSVGKDQKVSLGDMDYISWRHNLLHDKDILDEILDLIEPIVPDFDKKLQTLLDITPENTIAVGDGANDLSMFKFAGTRVAFCAKPVVKENATICIDQKDLRLILDKIL